MECCSQHRVGQLGVHEAGVLRIHLRQVGLPDRQTRQVKTAQLSAQQAQQVDHIARSIPLLTAWLLAPALQQQQQPFLQPIRIANGTCQSLQQRPGDQLLLAVPHILFGGGLDECMAAEQLRLSLHKLVLDGLHQLIGQEFEDDRLQGEGRAVGGALDQHAAAQRFERDQQRALRHGLAQISQ
jgi:hypothetical protein